jgi:hypothetical protein
MHLATCARPQEPLENAPRTALLEEWRWNSGGGEMWDGFWSDVSDEYYVRCTSPDGTTQWFRVEDDAASDGVAEPQAAALNSSARGRVALIVAQSPNGRRMLVGSARRAHR